MIEVLVMSSLMDTNVKNAHTFWTCKDLLPVDVVVVVIHMILCYITDLGMYGIYNAYKLSVLPSRLFHKLVRGLFAILGENNCKNRKKGPQKCSNVMVNERKEKI